MIKNKIMYLSLNWLKDFVDIPKSITPKQLGLKLTMHTVEIDGIKKQGENLENIVVGEILGIEKHPNADKLKVCKVNIGKKSRQIIFDQMLKVEIGQNNNSIFTFLRKMLIKIKVFANSK